MVKIVEENGISIIVIESREIKMNHIAYINNKDSISGNKKNQCIHEYQRLKLMK